MKCTCIDYENYRNIEKEHIELGAGMNVFYGENAQGKTNILEGLYLFARGKSFRTQNDKELIRFGEDSARLGVTLEGGTKLGAAFSRQSRRVFEKNGLPFDKTADMIGYLRAVLFCPEHLSLIQSGPSARRSFLDIAISQIKPVYIQYLSRYNRVLLQRNAMMKKFSSDASFRAVTDVLSRQLAEAAAEISAARAQYVGKVEQYAALFFEEMSGSRERASFSYGTTLGADFDSTDKQKTAELFYKQLTENTQRELKYGATLYGTHKDDVRILLNGKDARSFASQGQQRSLALAMKLSEGEISRESCGEYPIFLFDDVLSELDANRRAFLLENFSKNGARQTVITTCEESAFSAEYRYEVSGGKVTRK